MTEKYFIKRNLILPCLVTSIFFFGSFATENSIVDSGQNYQDNTQVNSKKEIMLGVLESLEEGVPYQKDRSWGTYRHEAFEFPGFYIPDLTDFKYDFDFSLPEFRFDESDIERFELRMEELSIRLEEKMEEMARRLDSVLKSK